MIERVFLTFLKRLLGLKKSTPSCFVLGEVGAYPLKIDVMKRSLSFWQNIITGKNKKYSFKMYQMLLNYFSNTDKSSKWIKHLKDTLDQLGFSYIWINQSNCSNPKALINILENRLKDQFRQQWLLELNTRKNYFYSSIKLEFGFERYLDILPFKFWRNLIKLRCSNHRLPIEKGRWTNTPTQERLCKHCKQTLGDEFHVLLECPSFTKERKLHIKKYFFMHPNVFKLNLLFNSHSKKTLKNLSAFVKFVCDKH